VERHISKIDMAHWTPHDLRRTASTQLAKLGVITRTKSRENRSLASAKALSRMC
jgi:integrase